MELECDYLVGKETKKAINAFQRVGCFTAHRLQAFSGPPGLGLDLTNRRFPAGPKTMRPMLRNCVSGPEIGPDCGRFLIGKAKIVPPAGLRRAGASILRLCPLESGRNSVRKTDFRPGT